MMSTVSVIGRPTGRACDHNPHRDRDRARPFTGEAMLDHLRRFEERIQLLAIQQLFRVAAFLTGRHDQDRQPLDTISHSPTRN
jgi:hypothetical protein